jgi:hypothetical protein
VSDQDRQIRQAMDSLRALPVPPPSAALMAAMRPGQVVAGRNPGRAFAVVLVVSLAALAVHLHNQQVRRDFDALPSWWLWTLAVAWLAVFVAPLAIVLVPARRSLLPSAGAVRLATLAVPMLAIAMTTVFRIDVPPTTKLLTDRADIIAELEWCLVGGLELIVAPFALGVFILGRSCLPVHRRWLGAALGAANGALAGLMLHLACGVGGALHTGVAHGGHAVLGAIAGSVLVPAATEAATDARV